MPVSSTQTATDKLAERRQLSDEIAILKQERDLLTPEVKRLSEAKTALLEEHGKHYNVSDLKDAVLENIRTRLRGENAGLETDKQKLLQRVSDLRQDESDIAGRVTRAKEDLAPAEAAVQKVRDTAAREGIALNKFRMDAAKEVEAHDAVVQKLRNEGATARLELELYEKEYQEKRREITEGEQRVAVREEDIAILEDRYKRKTEAVSLESLDTALAELERVKGLTSAENSALEHVRAETDKETADGGSKVAALQTQIDEKTLALADLEAKSADLVSRETAYTQRATALKDYEARLRARCLELYPEMEITI